MNLKKLLLGLLLLTPSIGHSASRTADIQYVDGLLGTRSYIANGNAEKKGAKSLNAYADAAGAAPVDGTGGSPASTCTRTTSSPLAGDGSFLITHSANNRQGEGCSIDFTIDPNDQAKVLQVAFDYAVASGTFAGGTDAAVGDLVLYIYDVTNATLIQPTSYKVLGSVSGQFYHHIANFQTASNSTSYRVIWHMATSTATAYTWKFDNVKISPPITNFGAPITDWALFTMSITGSGSNPAKGTISIDKAYWRRNGGNMEIRYEYAQTVGGANGSGTYQFNLPNSAVIDTTVTNNTGNLQGMDLGFGSAYDGTSITPFVLGPSSTSSSAIVMSQSNSTTGAIGSAFFALGNTVVRYAFSAKIPIAGWASSLLLSSDTDTRVVSVQKLGKNSPGGTGLGNAVQLAIFASVDKDTHGAYNTSTGVFTAPMPGFYRGHFTVEGTSTISANGALVAYVYKNGSQLNAGATVAGSTVTGQDLTATVPFETYLVAGDTLDFRNSMSGTTIAYATSFTGANFSIDRISGPSSIAATESVGASYSDSAGASISGSTPTVYKYLTKNYDTHNAYSTSTGLYTIPVSGKYIVSGSITTTSVTLATTGFVRATINKTGSSFAAAFTSGSGGSNTYTAQITQTVNCIAGDTIGLFVDASASTTSLTTALYNTFSISRVGN